MASVRASGNRSTEMRLIALFRGHRITGWRRGVRLAGRPDFVFRAAKVAIFVDGCFWHGCPRHGRIPKTRVDYWVPKIARNVARDRAATLLLREAGWRVVRIWECSLKSSAAEASARRIKRALQGRV